MYLFFKNYEYKMDKHVCMTVRPYLQALYFVGRLERETFNSGKCYHDYFIREFSATVGSDINLLTFFSVMHCFNVGANLS